MARKTRQWHSSGQVRRVRFSPWFTSRVWEISFTAAQFGFDFALRTSNFVSGDALIFEVCRGGDIREVQALFQSGEASPFDCSYGSRAIPGKTILAVSVAQHYALPNNG